MKSKITNTWKPPLAKSPFMVGYREPYEMSGWKWWVSDTIKNLQAT